MDISIEPVLPATQDPARIGATATPDFSHADSECSSPGAAQTKEHVQKTLDTLKRSARLAGKRLNEADIRVGTKVIVVDDRFRRK